MHTNPLSNKFPTRMYWPSIIGGIVLGLAIESLLNLLGLGLGFSVLDLDSDTMARIGIGSIIWLSISGIIAMFIGGWVAGRFSGTRIKIDSALHGLVAWGLSTLLAFILMLSTVGMIISGTVSALVQSVQAVANSAMQVNNTVNLRPVLSELLQQAEASLNAQGRQGQGEKARASATKSLSQAEQTALAQQLITLFTASTEDAKAAAREKLLQFLQQHTNLSQEEAESKLNEWQQQYNERTEQMRQQAQQSIAQAQKVLATTSLITVLVMLLGALAAAFGGSLGGNSRNADVLANPRED